MGLIGIGAIAVGSAAAGIGTDATGAAATGTGTDATGAVAAAAGTGTDATGAVAAGTSGLLLVMIVAGIAMSRTGAVDAELAALPISDNSSENSIRS